jgi:hemerythrin-like domain-containing protein
MLTQIGGKLESDFTRPLGMLSDCHKRIRYFSSALLATVTHADEGPLTVHECVDLETALRYFRDAAPKHTADEEQSLFPRLRCIDSPEVHATLRKIEGLEADHRKAESQHHEADSIIHQWMMEGRILPKAIARLRGILTELLELYERHILLEETNIFPLAEASLSDAEKSIVGREMAARRGIEAPSSNSGL